MINYPELFRLATMLPHIDVVRLRNDAIKDQSIENAWTMKIDEMLAIAVREAVKHIEETGKPPTDSDLFAKFFMLHSLGVMKNALERTEHEAPKRAKLAKPVPLQVPSSMLELKALYKAFTKQGYIPPKQRALADKVKKSFFKSIRRSWLHHSSDFLNGKTFNQDDAVQAFKKELKLPRAQAQTIVQTQTTTYYSEVRRAVYEKSPDVVGWLYTAVRDFATTKWCESRRGIVYHVGTSILDAETPANHWNCRSGLLPLTDHNPLHSKLLHDPKLAREKHSCEPLPVGWRR